MKERGADETWRLLQDDHILQSLSQVITQEFDVGNLPEIMTVIIIMHIQRLQGRKLHAKETLLVSLEKSENTNEMYVKSRYNYRRNNMR